MSLGFKTVTDLAADADLLRSHAYGVIEVVEGEFRQVRLRPFPKFVTPWDALFNGGWYHRTWPGNRCLLYYNQPRGFRSFLALKYVVSARDTTLATFRRALTVLDEIARLKRSDAILCDAANWRISGRLLTRWGWESHAPQRWHRNYIKRLYPNESRAEIATCEQLQLC